MEILRNNRNRRRQGFRISTSLSFYSAIRSVVAATFCILAFLQTPARAEVPREYQVKAVCLWRLAQFVDWPSNAFEKLDSPIVIGVFGANPFGDALDVAVRDETAHGRKLIVHYWQRVEEIRSCHILFISKPEAARFRKILAAVAGKKNCWLRES